MGKPKRQSARLASLFAMSIAALAGCNSSNSVSEIPEASRKALDQRKVDVKPRQAKASPPGGQPSKGSAKGR
jgi:hypothetical protein